MQQVGAQGLVTFLEQAIVYEEAKKADLTATEEEKAKFVSEDMSQEIYEGFAELYTTQALDRFIDYIILNRKYRQYLEDKFVREKGINITDEVANQYYVQNIGTFQPGERVWMSIISVETLETANEVLRKLESGENFSELASVYNADPELRDRQGYVGMIEKGQGLPPPIEEAAFALESEKYSQIIKGTLFHIVYVHNKKPAEKYAFNDVKEDIKRQLKEQEVRRYIDEYLNELYNRELQKFEIKANLFKVGEEP